MKKVIFVLAVFLVLGLLIGFFSHKSSTNSTKIQPGAGVTTTSTPNLPNPDDFQWGINTGPNALGDFSLYPEKWEEQIKIIKQLGVKWVRFGWEYQDGAHVFVRENDVLNALWSNGIDVMMVLEPTGDWEHGMDTYQNGYDTALKVSKYYKGKIKYYQILNEGGAMVIKTSTNSGQKESDFDQEKFKKIQAFMEGASKGIDEGDSAAKKIVTSAYTHTGYLDMVSRDSKIDFDYIGLDWYTWMGAIATKKMDDGKTLFTDKMKSYGKPMIFTEVNAWPEADSANSGKFTKVNTELQSSFIQETADWAYAHKDWVKGFYVFSLFDDNFSARPLYFGIYNTTKNGKEVTATSPKKAFTTYQAIIQKNPK